MKIPKSVKVGPYTIPIIRAEIPAEHEAAGFYDETEASPRIIVDSRLRGIRETETFVHEVMHAIDHIYGLRAKHRHVHGFANGLVQALNLAKGSK